MKGVDDHRAMAPRRQQRRHAPKRSGLRGMCMQDLGLPAADLPHEEHERDEVADPDPPPQRWEVTGSTPSCSARGSIDPSRGPSRPRTRRVS